MNVLKEAGVERIYQEHASGGRWDRPELHKLMGLCCLNWRHGRVRSGAV
ncbi:hypothetical protein [Deinococcus altitudinis]